MIERSKWTAMTLLVACLGAGLATSAPAQTANPKANKAPGYERATNNAKGATPAQDAAPSTDPDDGSARWDPVLLVTSVEVLRSTRGHELDIVRVRGLTSTDGWGDPQLVPLTKGKAVDGILDLLLVARAPSEAMQPTGFSSVDAVFVVEPEHPYKGIRVHAATNRVVLKQLPGYAEVTNTRNDCSDCVGKYFLAKGAAMPAGKAAADVIKEADLPLSLRVIKASDGIGKLETDPNRLTLLLDEDGMIEIAVWD